MGRKKGDCLLIGFAAETQNLQQEARRKLESKNCDMVVGNFVGGSELGFESDENEVVLALRTGESIALPRASKREIADRIFDEVLKLAPRPACRQWTLTSPPISRVLPGSGHQDPVSPAVPRRR